MKNYIKTDTYNRLIKTKLWVISNFENPFSYINYQLFTNGLHTNILHVFIRQQQFRRAIEIRNAQVH